jgi:hypothetical protein
MGQVRWAGWAMAIVTALVTSGVAARADIASDKPAAIVIYPKIAVDSTNGVDTVIRLSNANRDVNQPPLWVHCFYLDANSHCSGGSAEGNVCTGDPTVCVSGVCLAGWQEVDFRLRLTPGQPIEWKASDGLLGGRTCDGGSKDGKPCKIASDCPGASCTLGIPLTTGVCQRNPSFSCATNDDCSPFPGGSCTQSNSGTRIPGVPEDRFVGELKCIAIDGNGMPVPRNDLKGEALLETSVGEDDTDANLDVASYNAIGVQATTNPRDADPTVLTLGGDPGTAEYNGCPNFLILDHFFEDAKDPVPGSNNSISTNVVFVPCSEDLLRQIPGAAVVQYLVFNEFEQRFSTSKSVTCFQDTRLCKIDTPDCSRSIFNVNTAGTLTGQTKMNPISKPQAQLPGGGLLGIAVETHTGSATATSLQRHARSAAFNLQMRGARSAPDMITIPPPQ